MRLKEIVAGLIAFAAMNCVVARARLP